MDDQLKGFFRQLLQNAINSSIHSLIWRMPTLGVLFLLVVLIGVVVWFQMY